MKKIAVLLALALMLMISCAAVAESVSVAIVYSDTVDDKGFISYYKKRGWLDEENKPILNSYKKYVNDWMKKHP